MPKKIDYADLFTLRKDGRYMYRYTDDTGRHAIYDKDPERLFHRIHDPKPVEFVGNNPHLKQPKTAAGYRDAVLLDVLAVQIPSGSGYIFCTDSGDLLTKTMYRKRWEKYCAEIRHDITAHQLRHGFATILYEAGIGDKDAQELLGHSNITVTRDIYTHIRQSRKTETASKLNVFLAKDGI